MRNLLINLVGVSVIESVLGVLLPEGKMKSFVLSNISLFCFYCIVSVFCEILVTLV